MNNSEILFLYDAKLTNPNGDPDEENRPRMDDERDMNLVSDLRIKRYIRDYLLGRKHELFVQRIGDKPVTAEERMKGINDDTEILEKFIDVRLFGATMPIKRGNKQFIGPVQFNWGYSLNKVEILESSITSTFSSASGNRQGTMGKDYRVKYSFLAFSGVISAKRAEKTNLKEEDITMMDKAIKYAIPEQITRSKIGQYPRLYIRVEYKDGETILGDMRDLIKLNQDDNLRDISETELEICKLITFLDVNKSRVLRIHYFYDPKLALTNNGEKLDFKEAFDGFELKEVE